MTVSFMDGSMVTGEEVERVNQQFLTILKRLAPSDGMGCARGGEVLVIDLVGCIPM